ncbi:alpha/beta-hydrolase [Xylariaceae sp. FL0662B]|nr:alpha/beta-hydrolase [Xylariaceae sp. FL0662B]
MSSTGSHQTKTTTEAESLPAPLPLPPGISSEYVDCTASCGLNWHVLTAGDPGNPLVLFCHGYPEVAYSWRKVLGAIAAGDSGGGSRGYYCVAMDQRGYGRTTTTGVAQEDGRVSFGSADLSEYAFTNLVRDLVCLVYGLGYTTARAIVGHDFGAVSAALAALVRPDVFRASVQLSHPLHRPPEPPLGRGPATTHVDDIQAELARLHPPRKHYKWDNSSPRAAAQWGDPPQGLEAFLRGYFHVKSADWERNAPRPLRKWDAEALAVMPEYYIMRKDRTMPQTVADNMEGEDWTRTERWLPAAELRVYCEEWRRTGFQGALNWYRDGVDAAGQEGPPAVCGPADRGAVRVHQREAGLGQLPAAGRPRELRGPDGGPGGLLQGREADRGRGTLGAAGTAGGCGRGNPGVFEVVVVYLVSVR